VSLVDAAAFGFVLLSYAGPVFAVLRRVETIATRLFSIRQCLVANLNAMKTCQRLFRRLLFLVEEVIADPNRRTSQSLSLVAALNAGKVRQSDELDRRNA
jgi:hypothetical protein